MQQPPKKKQQPPHKKTINTKDHRPSIVIAHDKLNIE
jgi:hypothetical protein